MRRRTFIKSACGLVGSAALTTQLQTPLMAFMSAPDNPYADTIGLQLWTVRDQLATDKKATLKAIANAGYKQVELMDTTQGKDLLPICKDLGLSVTSSFINWMAICNPNAGQGPSLDKILEQATEAKLKHLVFGYIAKGFRETPDQFKRHADTANQFGEKCKKAGIQLCYHNHSFEFAPLPNQNPGKKCGYDVLIEELDNECCKFEFDVFWGAIGGWKPIETLKKLKGRVSQVHLKDLKAEVPTIYDEGKVPAEAFEELGDGMIDMAKVIQVSSEIGVEQCHVEQDQSPNPLNSIAQSLKHFQKL